MTKRLSRKFSAVVSPLGVNELTNDGLVVLGMFIKHKNRALAVDEMESLLQSFEVTTESEVVDVYTELEAAKYIKECPTEMHNDGTSRYRLTYVSR
jgi:hypothetical protein